MTRKISHRPEGRNTTFRVSKVLKNLVDNADGREPAVSAEHPRIIGSRISDLSSPGECDRDLLRKSRSDTDHIFRSARVVILAVSSAAASLLYECSIALWVQCAKANSSDFDSEPTRGNRSWKSARNLRNRTLPLLRLLQPPFRQFRKLIRSCPSPVPN